MLKHSVHFCHQSIYNPISVSNGEEGMVVYNNFQNNRDQSFFPARTVRSDHVAAVAFRKIRSHFFPPFFVGWDYFFHTFFPLSSTLTDITKYHANLIGWHAITNTGQQGRNLEGILTMLASPIWTIMRLLVANTRPTIGDTVTNLISLIN
jgi:hypothetical protein